MARKRQAGPTDRELTILHILWENGPSTVREVNKAMNDKEETGYTTTLKLMQIMVDKGLLICDKSQWRHVFKPALTREKTQKRLVSNLLDKAFAGSAEHLVMQALSVKSISAQELARIRKLIETYEGDRS